METNLFRRVFLKKIIIKGGRLFKMGGNNKNWQVDMSRMW